MLSEIARKLKIKFFILLISFALPKLSRMFALSMDSRKLLIRKSNPQRYTSIWPIAMNILEILQINQIFRLLSISKIALGLSSIRANMIKFYLKMDLT